MAAPKIFTRDFTLCFFAQFAFSAVLFSLVPTIPIYLSRRGTAEAEIGILVGALSVFSLLLRPLIGRALLRTPERRFMLAGTVLVGLASAAYLIAPPFWPLLLVRVLHGTGVAFFFTASFTLAARITPETSRGKSLSYFQLSINLAFALSPSFGILLVNRFDFPALFAFCAGLSVVSFYVASRLGKEWETHPSESLTKKPPAILSRAVLVPSSMAALNNVIWGALTTFFPLYAIRHGVENPGFFFAIFAVMLVLGRGLGGGILDAFHRDRIILPCMIAHIVAMTLLPFSQTMPLFALVAVIWGAGSSFLYPTLVSFAVERAGRSPGPAMGTFTAITELGTGMGSVIMGVILQVSSYRTMFLCLALTGVLNFVFFFFFVRGKGGTNHADL
jgi:predicted MFS family arabinose efflux permease